MSTFPERSLPRQAQHFSYERVQLPLGLVEAATLLCYPTIRDAEGQDVPAVSAIRPRLDTDFFLGAALMDLALNGRIRMDETTPLEKHAYDYARRQKLNSWKGLLVVLPPLVLFIAGIIALQQAQSLLSSIFFLGFGAYIILTLLILMVWGLLTRGKTAQGRLGVVDTTPTDNYVLDNILAQMLSAGGSRRVDKWLKGQGALKADDLYEITQQRLAEQGWITLTGERHVPLLGELETLVINRHTEQWQALSNQLRSAFLLGGALAPDMLALLLLLTLFTDTFMTPRQLRLPGQPHNRIIVHGLYQVLSSPEELTIARQRLRAIMQGDPAIAESVGLPFYDTLLSIRNGTERSKEARRSSS